MLSKKTFVDAIEKIEAQMKLDSDLNHQLAKMDSMSSLWLSDKMLDLAIQLINESMALEKNEFVGTDVDFYLFEHKNKKKPFVEINKKKIYVKNALQLYDYINKGKK